MTTILGISILKDFISVTESHFKTQFSFRNRYFIIVKQSFQNTFKKICIFVQEHGIQNIDSIFQNTYSGSIFYVMGKVYFRTQSVF